MIGGYPSGFVWHLRYCNIILFHEILKCVALFPEKVVYRAFIIENLYKIHQHVDSPIF